MNKIVLVSLSCLFGLNAFAITRENSATYLIDQVEDANLACVSSFYDYAALSEVASLNPRITEPTAQETAKNIVVSALSKEAQRAIYVEGNSLKIKVVSYLNSAKTSAQEITILVDSKTDKVLGFQTTSLESAITGASLEKLNSNQIQVSTIESCSSLK